MTLPPHDLTPPALLDVCGLSCPLPVLKIARAMRAMPAGAVLKILATDPNTTKELHSLCDETGYEIVSLTHEGDVLHITLRK